MQVAANIRRRGARYFFRRKVPSTLRARFPRHEVVVSLRTSERRTASYRARALWLECERLFETVARDPSLDGEAIEALARSWLRRRLEETEVELATGGALVRRRADGTDASPASTKTVAAQEQIELLVAEANASHSLLERNLLDFASEEVEQLCREEGVQVERDSVEWKLLARAVLRAKVELPLEAARRLKGDYGALADPSVASLIERHPALKEKIAEREAIAGDGPRTSEVDGTANPAPRSTATATQVATGYSTAVETAGHFKELWERFVDSMLAEQLWAQHMRSQSRSTCRLWLELVGDAPVESYTRRQASAFREAIFRLPSDYAKAPRWKGRSISEILEDPESADGSKLSVRTVERHIAALSRFWSWLTDGGYLPRDADNIFSGLSRLKRKRKALASVRQERFAWDRKRLEQLFGSPVWTGCDSAARRSKPGKHVFRDAKFWAPLIGAFSGMRREEIASLTVGDVKHEHGIWYFNVAIVDPDNPGKDGRVKTRASLRKVPLHEELLRIGLIEDLVDGRRPEEQLFKELKPAKLDGSFGEGLGKWFSRYRKDIGVYHPKIDFHSFRHTVTTQLENTDAKRVWIEEIIGHESGERRSEAHRYTKEIKLKNLKATIDKLDLGIDLSHLYRKGK